MTWERSQSVRRLRHNRKSDRVDRLALRDAGTAVRARFDRGDRSNHALGEHDQACTAWQEALQLYQDMGRDTDIERAFSDNSTISTTATTPTSKAALRVKTFDREVRRGGKTSFVTTG
jgi:hypothetical protein